MTMKILGSKIKHYRRDLGLSQKELAEGVCTQATISLIEKQNKVPSIRILLSICERLNIELDDIMDSERNETKTSLSQTRELVIRGDFEAALTLINQLNVNEILDMVQLKQYYTIKGIIQLLRDQNPDKAIFSFNQTLSHYTPTTSIYDLEAVAGLVLAYIDKNDLEDALSYVKQLQKMLSNHTETYQLDNDTKIFVDYAMGIALFKAGRKHDAIKYIDQGIEIAKAKQTLVFLAIFYGLNAFCDDITAAKNKMIACALAEIVHLDLAKLLFSQELEIKKWVKFA
ncbi:helix-turn-helix domain-containing protein [Agrilactobacillus fermenti]|uniref:helix-turn-helix domain-containing protein n=1 Tax=Agrilactobacillus fermenti TaxID=2586909 RepID=UPI001E5A2313|nr:helix-turn-helix transcriptional regulator [Agrilactobacillus fermenti]MCD2256465.1 helix-turn-helix transcriptional regulator [Agrilactobacillus fermenti]